MHIPGRLKCGQIEDPPAAMGPMKGRPSNFGYAIRERRIITWGGRGRSDCMVSDTVKLPGCMGGRPRFNPRSAGLRVGECIKALRIVRLQIPTLSLKFRLR